MAVAFRSATNAENAAPAVPAGTTAGDLLVLIVHGGGTAGAGYTLQRTDGGTRTYTRPAAGAGDAPVMSGTQYVAWLGAYTGAHLVAPIADAAYAVAPNGGPFTCPSVTPSRAGSLLLCHLGGGTYGGVGSVVWNPPAGMTERLDYSGTASGFPYANTAADQQLAGTGATGTRTFTPGASNIGNLDALSLIINVANVAPNAPTPTYPTGGVSVERAAVQRLSWAFSDSDAGDSQSKFDLQWRVGAGAWTTVTETTPNTFYDAPAATFPLGSVEWQVRTYDAQGVVGPWSASAFFTAASTPGLPAITAPLNGAVIATGDASLTWSAPAQESYQVRRVADNAGAADTATVYADTGEVVSNTARLAPLAFAVNNRYEHVQVRIKNSGLWSSWASVRVQVSFTPPLSPLLVAIAMDAAAAIQALITNPLGNLLTTNQASIETDASGWAASNAVASRSAAQALNGSASLALTTTAAGDVYAYPAAGVAASPVMAGQVYTFVASYRAATVGRAVRTEYAWYTTAGAYISGGPGPAGNTADNTAGWTQAATTAQAPATAAYATVVVYIVGAAAGEVHYVDAIGLFPDPTGNLVTNPGFENGTAGWNGFGGGTIAASTTQAYTGRQSVAITPSSNVGSGSDFRIYSDYVKASVGTVLTASVYVWSPVATTGLVQVQHDNAAGTGTLFTDQGGITAIPASTWTRLTCTATVPAGGGSERVEPVVLVNAGVTFYVDAVQVVVGNVAQPWLPPTTSNLVRNPSLEADTNYWYDAGFGAASVARDTSWAYVGAACLKIVKTAAGVDPRWIRHGIFEPWLPAGVYTVSAWVYSPDVTGLRFQTDGDLAHVHSNQVKSTALNTWQRVSQTITVTSGSRLDFVDLTGDAAQVGTVYVDALQIEAGSAATPYVDGSLGAGYSWEAAENLISVAGVGLEDGSTGGWVAEGTSVVVANSAAQAHSGTKSLAVSWTSGVAPRGAYVAPGNVTDIVGQILTLSAWVFTPVAADMRISHSDNVASQQDGPLVPVPANTWTRLVHTVRVGNAGAIAALKVYSHSPASAGTFYVDDAQIEAKDHATAANAPGTAHASTSRRQFPWATPPAAVTTNDIYRRVGGVGAGIRVAKALAPNAAWTDYTPASGQDYQYLVRAVGANGTTADSAWVG